MKFRILFPVFLLAAFATLGQQTFKPNKGRFPGKVQVKGDFKKISGKAIVSEPSKTLFFQGDLALNKNLRVVKDPESGAVIYIENLEEVQNRAGLRKSAQTLQNEFMSDIRSHLKMKDTEQELKSLSVAFDAKGNRHERFQQYYGGLRVYGAEMVLHADESKVKSMNGRVFPTPEKLRIQPQIKAPESVALGFQGLSSVSRIEASSSSLFKRHPSTSELIIYHKEGKPVLAYELELHPNQFERWVVFLDAQTGEVLDKYNHTCTLDGVFSTQARDLNGVNQSFVIIQSGQAYYLIDPSKEMFDNTRSKLPDDPRGAIWTIDANNSSIAGEMKLSHVISNNGTAWNATAVSAHRNATVCYDYYRNTFNRNSLDGSGGNIISVINITDEDGLGMDNAYWNGEFMGYGNGRDGFKPLAGALDVAGHEMTHGVIESTARLEYRNQSGALNESFADIFATMIDRDDWVLGEDVVKGNVFPSGALRSLENPNQGGKNDPGYQPKNMDQYVFLRDIPSEDNGGVHINSGIPNHAFFLFATASGMNREKAERIYYHTLTNYLTRTSKFVDLRLAVIQSAKDLFGNGVEAQAAAAAFDAVGIVTGSGSNGGSTSQPDEVIAVNPGDPMVVVYEPSSGNLYRGPVSGAGGFDVISEGIGCLRKPSITDDGSLLFFVGDDNNIYFVDLTKGQTSPTAFTNDGVWGNVAISKDGKLLAALTNSQDAVIYVYNIQTQKQASFELYNPTYTQGVSTGEVQFADSFEWDYSGEYLIYDALNLANGVFGELEYWDVGIIRVWDASVNDFGEGTIQKLFTDLGEGENIGNPAISKTNPNVIAFDYGNLDTQEFAILGVNLNSGDINVIVENNTIGYPDFSVDDKFLAYTGTQDGVGEVVKLISLNADRISSPSSTGQRYFEGGEDTFAVFYALGQRQLPEKQSQTIDLAVPAAQNPGASLVLTAKASSGLPVQFSVVQGDATISGNRVSLGTTPGQVIIEAFQVGNDQFVSVSTQVSFCINPPVPSVLQNGDNLVASGFTSYQWYVNGSAIGGFTANATLKPDRNGVYAVKSVTNDGCFSSFSNQVTIQKVLSVINQEDIITIYPNPGQEILRISLPEGEFSEEVSVLTLQGRKLIQLKSDQVDIGNLPAGTYILKVKTGKTQYSRSFVKR